MGRFRVTVLAGAMVAVVAASYIGWSAGRGAPAPDRSAGDRTAIGAAAFDPAPRGERAELGRLIAAYESQVADRPTAAGLSFLGQLYVARGRLTGDVTSYVQADDALNRAVQLFPKDLEARGLLASVRYTTHDFAGALAGAKEVVVADSQQWVALATQADAEVETGDYEAARRDEAALAAALPHVAAVEVRQARLAFLDGDSALAASLAAEAERDARAAGIGGAGLAFYQAFRSQVDLDQGHYNEALQHASDAVRSAPDWYVALAQLGKARAAHGDVASAIDAYTKAIAIVPQPEYLAALGDLEAVRHHDDAARQAHATVRFIATLAAINRQVYNRQLVLFDADHGTATEEAVRLAGAELAVRHDVYAWDAYAWALFADGRFADAAEAAPHALVLGTHDAKLLYHAGMIAAAVHDDDRARRFLEDALALSPRFDPLGAPRARAELDKLMAS